MTWKSGLRWRPQEICWAICVACFEPRLKRVDTSTRILFPKRGVGNIPMYEPTGTPPKTAYSTALIRSNLNKLVLGCNTDFRAWVLAWQDLHQTFKNSSDKFSSWIYQVKYPNRSLGNPNMFYSTDPLQTSCMTGWFASRMHWISNLKKRQSSAHFIFEGL